MPANGFEIDLAARTHFQLQFGSDTVCPDHSFCDDEKLICEGLWKRNKKQKSSKTKNQIFFWLI